MADRAKCVGCIYFRPLSDGLLRACHHLLDTKERRKEDETGCLSRNRSARKEKGKGVINVLEKRSYKQA